MALPLTSRELLRLSRRKGYYSARMIAPVCSALFMCGIWAVAPVVQPETVGYACYFAALIAQYVTVYIVVPVTLADAIARETEERTLSILLLANPRAYDIVLSKFLAPMVLAGLLILGTLPLMAFAGFFGALAPAQANRQVMMSLATALAVGAMTMVASVVASRPRHALWSAYAAVAVSMLIAESLHRSVAGIHCNPWRPVATDAMTDASTRILPLLLGMPVLAAMLLAVAILLLPRQISSQRVPRGPVRPRLRRGMGRVRPVERPLYRLLACAEGSRSIWTRPWSRIALYISVAVVCYWVGLPAWIVLTALVAYQTHGMVNQLSLSGAMDDLRLATPDGRALGQALFQHQYRTQLFTIPAFLAAGAQLVSGVPFQVAAMLTAGGLFIATMLVRFAVGHACAHWRMPSSGRVALAVLWNVLLQLFVGLALGGMSVVFAGCFVAWFRLEFPGSDYALMMILFLVIGGMLLGNSRDARLKFELNFDRDLANS